MFSAPFHISLPLRPFRQAYNRFSSFTTSTSPTDLVPQPYAPAHRSNEEQVGTAVQASSIPRSEIFLTTKLGHADKISSRLNESVTKIDPSEGGYVDLFLIHAPSAGPEKRVEQWGELEKLVKEKKAKSIGVSN